MTEANIRSGRITAIEPQKRDPERLSVFINGAFAFGIDRLLAAQHGLSVGQQLSEPALAGILAAEEESRATQAALRLLGYRARSVHELQSRLARRGFSPNAIERAIERLKEWRYVDDEQFAEAWVENRASHAPRGRRVLRQELIRKGIDRSTVDRVVDEAELDERGAARELARGRARSLQGLEPEVQRRRLVGFLQRRGYGWDVVRPVLDEVLGELNDEDSSGAAECESSP